MPSRAGLNSTVQAPRKVISRRIDAPDHHHPQTDGAAHVAEKPFTSALDTRLIRPTTALRRRGSDGGSRSSRDSSSRHRHSRSPSMDSPTEPHPLRRSNTNPKTTRYDDRGSTRPHLSHVLAPSSPVLVRPPDGLPQLDSAEPHRIVLAHEVLPNDTLAGVALRYGISLTELRRANQLWASDSIHLRQILYVPLDKARYTDLETVTSLLARRTDSEQDAGDALAPCLDPSCSDSSTFVRRIPSANLSFFPPPSTRPSTPPPPPALGGSPYASTPPFYSRSNSPATVSTQSRGGPSLASGLRANALSSFFSILPINASTRDEIMSRLSIDSVSNSTTASDEAEHELATVPTTPKVRADAPVTVSAPLAVNPSSRRKNHHHAHTWFSSESNDESYGYGAGGEPHPHPRPPRDVEQIALASSPIHTMQMQPAPSMQLPESMTRSPPKGYPLNDPQHSDAWRASGDDHRRLR